MATQTVKQLRLEIRDFFFDEDSSPARIKNLKAAGEYKEDHLAISLIKCFCEPSTDSNEKDKRYIYAQEGGIAASLINKISKFEQSIPANHQELRRELHALGQEQHAQLIHRSIMNIDRLIQNLDQGNIARRQLAELIKQVTDTQYFKSVAMTAQFVAPPPTFGNTIASRWNLTNLFHWLDFLGEMGRAFCGGVNRAVRATGNNPVAIFFGYVLKVFIGGPLIIAKFVTHAFSSFFSWENVCSGWGAFSKGQKPPEKVIELQAPRLQIQDVKDAHSRARAPVAPPSPVSQHATKSDAVPVTARKYAPSPRSLNLPPVDQDDLKNQSRSDEVSQVRNSVAVIGKTDNADAGSPQHLKLGIPPRPSTPSVSENESPRGESSVNHESADKKAVTPSAKSSRGRAGMGAPYMVKSPQSAAGGQVGLWGKRDSVSLPKGNFEFRIEGPGHRRGGSQLDIVKLGNKPKS